ncbi:hypothetical protein [Guptibacillus hwajinpoensis]|uniref:hypothetical protein n=1 Tax=Guptibacillus hwajinpoensis TaxID=208199 RepID=UPI0024B3C8FA|nr:hypothetical protein [Pseudalkalibacillus hwajinpoensis]
MPTINQVIESYNELEKLSDAPLTIISEVLWIIVGLIFIMHLIHNRKFLSPSKFLFRGAFLFIILLIIGYLSYTLNSYDFSMNEKSWKENTLAPYLQSLHEHNEQVEDFSQLLKDPDNGIKSNYVDEDISPIWIELATTTDTGEKKEKIVEATIVKEPIQQPYLTYRMIEKNISDHYSDEAYYETTLHIPEDYMILTD